MEFGQLGATHLTECFTISLSYETYKTYFLDRRPPKMHRTSQYGICFMGVLDGLMRTVMSHGPQSKLSVVVEAGTRTQQTPLGYSTTESGGWRQLELTCSARTLLKKRSTAHCSNSLT